MARKEPERFLTQEDEMEEEKPSWFMTIPSEIQEDIVKTLTDFVDVKNVFDLYPHLYENLNLNDWFQEMKTLHISKQVFSILIRKKYLRSDDALKSRLVSKTWKESVDEHYRTANIHSVTYEGGRYFQYPRAVIRVPLTHYFPDRLELLANHGGNPFVGNRLMLKCCMNEDKILASSTTKSLIKSEQFAHVWKHVQHLEIWEDDTDDEEETDPDDDYWVDVEHFLFGDMRGDWRVRQSNLLRPILEMMENVKTVMFSLRGVSTRVLRSMPALATLEQLIVSAPRDRYYSDKKVWGWDKHLASACKSNLKLLSWTIGMRQQELFAGVVFDQLKEIRVSNCMLKILKNYSRSDIGDIFPAVRVIGLLFNNGNPDMYGKLVEIVNKFISVKHVVISCRNRECKRRILDYVVGPDAARLRRGLDKIVIENVGSSWVTKKFETIVRNFGALFATGDPCKILSIADNPDENSSDEEYDWGG